MRAFEWVSVTWVSGAAYTMHGNAPAFAGEERWPAQSYQTYKRRRVKQGRCCPEQRCRNTRRHTALLPGGWAVWVVLSILPPSTAPR